LGQELLEVSTSNMLDTEIIAIAHDQMAHYRLGHQHYTKINLTLPEKTYPVRSTLKLLFVIVVQCHHIAIIVCYHEDGSKKLNACIRFFLHMVYF
jgi:hypothetical protein